MGKDPAIIAVVDLLVDAINDGIAVMADGKVDILDFPKVANLLPGLLGALGQSSTLVDEIKALNVEEGAEIVTHVMGRLNIQSGRALAIVQASLKLAASIHDLVVALKK